MTTRRRLNRQIEKCLGDRSVDPAVRDIIVDCTLNYLLDYTQQLSEELMSKNLHSESMSAGAVITKLKTLLSVE